MQAPTLALESCRCSGFFLDELVFWQSRTYDVSGRKGEGEKKDSEGGEGSQKPTDFIGQAKDVKICMHSMDTRTVFVLLHCKCAACRNAMRLIVAFKKEYVFLMKGELMLTKLSVSHYQEEKEEEGL